MTTLLRSEFLSPHPATALWWEQRPTCERCAHVRVKIEGHKDRTQVLRCNVVRNPVGRQFQSYCIDARAGACGPEAKLFKEARK